MSECIVKSTRTKSQARTLWIKKHGPLPEGIYVLHSCDNHYCINEEHWFLGTQEDNMQDMISKGRQKFIGAPGNRSQAKLTDQNVIDIRNSPNKRISDWAKELGLSHQVISYARRGLTFKDLPGGSNDVPF